jgi:hypothetical protein
MGGWIFHKKINWDNKISWIKLWTISLFF